MRIKWTKFFLTSDKLYHRSHFGLYLCCLGPEEAIYVMREIHEGDCGNHSCLRTLVNKVLQQGFYWPTMKANSKEFTKKCDSCQWFAPIIHSPAELLSSICNPYPFMKLGMDIVDPLPVAFGKRKFVLAITNYFSKWVKARAFVHAKEADVDSFV